LRHDAAVSEPFLLLQLSDFHIGAEWADADSAAGLTAAVKSVLALGRRPDALLVSGDLSDNATDAEYELVLELLAPLGAPLYVLPGNHDDRDALRRHFGIPGVGGELVQYSADLGPMRLLVLDTAIRGQNPGILDAERLTWLDAELASEPDAPTVIAMHQPPYATGIPLWDDNGLPAADRRALADVVERHRQVKRLVAGHFHRTIAGTVAGRSTLVVPSTYAQGRLDFAPQEIELSDEPAGFAVHALVDGEFASHVQPVD
jgi:Icc protein